MYINHAVAVRQSDGEVVVGILINARADEPGRPNAAITLSSDTVIPVRSIQSITGIDMISLPPSE
jgi:hypothetical protein